MHASPYFDLKLFEPVATPPGPEIAEAYIDNYRNQAITRFDSWSMSDIAILRQPSARIVRQEGFQWMQDTAGF